MRVRCSYAHIVPATDEDHDRVLGDTAEPGTLIRDQKIIIPGDQGVQGSFCDA